MPKKNRCDIKSDCRRITEESLLSPYTKSLGKTKESKRGAKPVRLYSPLFVVILVLGTKSPQIRHKELTKKASNTIRFGNLNCTFGNIQMIFV